MKYPNIWGHRGCSTRFPENTLVAFEAAAKLKGITGIETDVQMSKDGVLMIMHDEKLDRTTNGQGELRNYTLEELKGFEIQGVDGQIERIPTLEEMFELLAPYCKENGLIINLELKNSIIRYEGMEEKVLAMVEKFGLEDYIVYSSFLPESMGLVKELKPDAKTGILGEKIHFCYDNMLKYQADAVHPWWDNLSCDSDFLDKLSNVPVRVWNMEEPFFGQDRPFYKREMMEFAKYGVTDVITNVPEVYLQ